MKAFAFLAAVAALSLAGCASTPAKPHKPKNLALGIEGVANNHILDFVATNAFDGDTASYWEGAANEYPNTLTVDLGKKAAVKEFVLKLNPRRLWAERTQTIEIQSSDNGSDFVTVVPKADYQFDPIDGGNLVTVPVQATAEWFRLVFTANSEATAGQLAEWEIHS